MHEQIQLKVTEFSAEERVVHLGKNRLNPDSISDNTSDLSSDFDIDRYLVIASPLSNGIGSEVMERTNSDGRSVGSFLENPITDSQGRIYSDILIKGVGVNKESTKVTPVKSPSVISSRFEGKSTQKKSTRVYPQRYSVEDIRGVSGKYGFSAPLEITILEDNLGQVLADAGLRTRKLIFCGEFSEEVPISLGDTVIKAEKVKEVFGYMPGVEVWAMRSRYRVEDLLGHSQYTNSKVIDEMRSSRFMKDENHDTPYHLRVKRAIDLNSQKQEEIKKDFSSLAKEIIQRAKSDEDERFSALAELYEDKGLTSEFWYDYLLIFASVLGEQVGIMYSQAAFTKDRMLNPQNVTLLAEIVDHDVTFISQEKKSDGLVILNQFFQTLSTLCYMATDLYAFGLIEENADLKKIIQNFAEGLILKLENKDKKLLKETLKNYINENNKSIDDFRPYNDIKEAHDKYKDNPAMQKFIQSYENKMKVLEKKIVHSPIEISGSSWSPNVDYLGGAQMFHLVNFILNY